MADYPQAYSQTLNKNPHKQSIISVEKKWNKML